ncbi:MAG: hypothetical protein LBT93_00560 [Treponema sp.]|nr:hypothetical protein [Treponema sp.]
MKQIILGLAVLALFPLPLLRAGDIRTNPININIVIDGSSAFKKVKDEALNWLCDQVLEGILTDGDNLTIWIAGGRAEQVYSSRINGTEDKESVKGLLKSFSGDAWTGSAPADFIGALQEAASRISGESASRNTYTLLIGSSASSISSSLEKDRTGLLRFFMTEDFANWQALVVALGVAPQVQRAAAAYMNGDG